MLCCLFIEREGDDVVSVDNWLDGLSTRSRNAIKAEGYTSRDDVFDAFMEKSLKHIPNIGKMAISEICLFFNIDEQPSELDRKIYTAKKFLEKNGFNVTKINQ